MGKITQVNNGDTGLQARNKINEAMKTIETDESLSGDGTAGNPLKLADVITDEQPTASLKFDKKYQSTRSIPIVMSGDLNLTLNTGVDNEVGNYNYYYVQADGVGAINLDTNFNDAAIIPSDLDGKVLDAGLYAVYTIYDSDGIRITVPAVAGTIPDTPPTATNVLISGSPVVGETLTGTYTYNDINGDPEQGTTYQWYRADDGQGLNESVISGATSQTYTLQGFDETKYIRFGVTPANVNAVGSEAFSPYSQEITATDTQPPVISFIPANGATNQVVDTSIKVVANEAIRQIGGAEITNANVASLITLRYPQLLQDIPFSASINAGKTEITIVPDSNLLFNRDVETTLADVEDNSSNAVGSDSVGTFTTAASGVFDPETLGSVATLLYGENIAVADDAEILTWPDASLQTKPAVATTGSAPIAKTVNGKKVARFSGTDELMRVDNVTALGGTNVDMSMYIVYRADEPTGNNVPIALDDDLASNSKYLTPIRYQANKEINTRRFGANIFNSYYNSLAEIWVINKKGTLLDIYRNGVLTIKDHNITNFEVGGLLRIGGYVLQNTPAGLEFFSGDIYEIGAFYKQLAFNEVDYLNTGLSAKYSILLNTAYQPSYVDETNLVVAYEGRSVDINTNGFALENIYPVNLSSDDRVDYNFNVVGKNITLGVSGNTKSIELPGTQSFTSVDVSGLTSAFDAGNTDNPFCIFVVSRYDADGVNQLLFGLLFTSSSNNNMGLIGRSAIDENYLYRRVTVNMSRNNLGAIDNNRHVLCYNIKSTGLMDVWQDGVKIQSDLNEVTGVALAFDNVLALGNNQPNNSPVTGAFELGYIYDNEKTDQVITDTFASINADLNVY